ncbi:hypothetical protein E2C01_023538 [Portunus trituberculatus]|uniref:Uncharacterized protein n=1 Tax=Portunus trituberculatus TaxID=210409 RepID=A0A5B7EA94_PORTR|nr:hypothetical protein [Portunus trituberculatus]
MSQGTGPGRRQLLRARTSVVFELRTCLPFSIYVRTPMTVPEDEVVYASCHVRAALGSVHGGGRLITCTMKADIWEGKFFGSSFTAAVANPAGISVKSK